MEFITLHSPSVYRQIPGLNNDKPIIVMFETKEDAMAYWKNDDGVNDEYDPGMNFLLNKNETISVDYDKEIDMYFMSHKQVEEHIEKLYANWCLRNNWDKLDNEAGIYVCGNNLFDQEYRNWVEEQLNFPNMFEIPFEE